MTGEEKFSGEVRYGNVDARLLLFGAITNRIAEGRAAGRGSGKLFHRWIVHFGLSIPID